MAPKKYQGFLTLLEREYYRFARLSKQTIAPPVITTLLFIFIFGFSLGSRIREIEGFSYILFILPGLAAMGVITNSYANTSTSLFMARMDRSIENILVSPISNFQIVSAFVLGGVFRGMVIGVITFIISILCVNFPIHHYAFTFLILFFSSVIFSCLGIISALWSESWDQIATFTNFLITPFVYLGGVFYSIQMLPPFWYRISFLNPIFYIVDALRFGTLGHGDIAFSISLAVVSTVALFSFIVTVWLFKRGYKLVS